MVIAGLRFGERLKWRTTESSASESDENGEGDEGQQVAERRYAQKRNVIHIWPTTYEPSHFIAGRRKAQRIRAGTVRSFDHFALAWLSGKSILEVSPQMRQLRPRVRQFKDSPARL